MPERLGGYQPKGEMRGNHRMSSSGLASDGTVREHHGSKGNRGGSGGR